MPKLPIGWTEKELRFGAQIFRAYDHAPVLIQPNPFADRRYVVIDSGHSFHEKELASLNYVLFPRHGDWAVVKAWNKLPRKSSDPLDEAVIQVGFFHENWRFP